LVDATDGAGVWLDIGRSDGIDDGEAEGELDAVHAARVRMATMTAASGCGPRLRDMQAQGSLSS
jgi:hypothetical protein